MLLRRTQLRLEQLDDRWLPSAVLPGEAIPAAVLNQWGIGLDPRGAATSRTPDTTEADSPPTWADGEATPLVWREPNPVGPPAWDISADRPPVWVEYIWVDNPRYGPQTWDDMPAGADGPVNLGSPSNSTGPPAGPAGPTVPAAGDVTATPDGRTSTWYPPSVGTTKISGPGRINFPVGTVIVISDVTPEGDAAANRRVAPPGTPVITGVADWKGVLWALAGPGGQVTALVISGHGQCGGVQSSAGGIEPEKIDPATIDLIKSKMAPGAPIIITGCQCGNQPVCIQDLQVLADKTGHPVIVCTGDCAGNETNGDWIRIDPKPPNP